MDRDNGMGVQRPALPARCNAWLTEQPVVLGVGPDPEPHQAVSRLHSESPMVGPDAGRPKATDLLEVERRIPRIALRMIEGVIGRLAHTPRQSTVGPPELGGRAVLQSGLVLPSA